MFWLQRPPYLRWAAAVAVIAGAVAWDLRAPPVETRPFLAAAVAAGEPITSADVEWRDVPAGLLPAADLSRPVAAVDLEAGTPVIEAVLRNPVAAPAGWWEVPVAVGAHASAGDEVLLVVVDPPSTVLGLVVSAQRGDPYSLDYVPASVAVPAESAPLVAAASAGGTLVAAIRAGGETALER